MKFKILLILLLGVCLYAKNSYENSFFLKRQDGSFINYYLFKVLENKKSDELLLILQGSDCNSVFKKDNIFNYYRKVRPHADLLLIEKYGIDKTLSVDDNAERKDCPISYLKNDNPKQRLEDIKAVLNKEYKNKYKKLIVLGGSEGAVIANLLSSSIHVDATISFSGGGRWFLDDVLHSILVNNTDKYKAKEEIESFKDFYKEVIKNKPFDIIVSNHGYYWWNQMFKIDQEETIKKINTPLLIVQGEIDTSVSFKKVDEMMTKIKNFNKDNIDYIRYKNLDHIFNNKKGKSYLEKIIKTMKKWLNNELK